MQPDPALVRDPKPQAPIPLGSGPLGSGVPGPTKFWCMP